MNQKSEGEEQKTMPDESNIPGIQQMLLNALAWAEEQTATVTLAGLDMPGSYSTREAR